MDSSQLYVELLRSGERMVGALANEREANIFSPADLTYERWQDRLAIARRDVQRAAEYYALALKNFRETMLSELVPHESAQPRNSGLAGKHRERVARLVPGSFHNGWRHATRNSRKDVASESHSVLARLSKSQ